MNRTHFGILSVTAAVLTITGCSNDGGSTPSPPSSDVTATAPPSTTTVTVAPAPMTEAACKPHELDPRCWNTNPDTGGTLLGIGDNGEVFDVSPSADWEHGYDVIVFNVSSLTDVQFKAEYVDAPDRIVTEGKGDPVNLFGMADLRLIIQAPANGNLFNGFDYRASAEDYGVLRQVKYAGSFEGQTTFGIGVDHKVRFAVESELGGSSGTDKVIVYLAHE